MQNNSKISILIDYAKCWLAQFYYAGHTPLAYTLLNLVSGLLLPSLYHLLVQRIFCLLVYSLLLHRSAIMHLYEHACVQKSRQVRGLERRRQWFRSYPARIRSRGKHARGVICMSPVLEIYASVRDVITTNPIYL